MLFNVLPLHKFYFCNRKTMAKEIKRELPEVLEIDFIICDNTLNRKGWKLLVEGIDTEGFLKNPVCVVQHNTWSVPVGKWKNLRVENGQLLGTVDFDRNDEDAVKLYWKYKDGYMNAVSLHIIPLIESEESSMLVQGQRYPTITKSELLEVSLVTIPGQKNAVKLCTPEGGDYKLNIINNKSETQMKEEEKDKSSIEEMQKKLDAACEKNAKNLVKLHVQRGVVQDGEVDSLEKLAMSDYDTVEKLLEARTPAKSEKTEDKGEEGKKLSEEVKKFAQNSDPGKSGGNERDAWTYYDYFRKDPKALNLMREKEPEKFKKLEADFNEWAVENNLKAE
jgi:hypothetical protein